MSKLILINEKLKSQMVSSVLDNVPNIEKSVFDEVMKIIDSIDSTGGSFATNILTPEKLQEIETRIFATLKNSGYIQSVDVFIKDMSKITINSQLLLSEQGFEVQKLQLNPIEVKWKKQTVTTLLDSGIREDFVRPILKVVDDAISYGDSINTTRNKLSEFVLSGKDKSGKLKSYLTQTARDSVNQLQGQQYQSVANVIGYEGVSYIGGLLEDSRGQCKRWVNDLNGFIPIDQLKAEIALAYKNQARKLKEGEHKWGGMMPNTTPDNFIVKRGGFNCTHAAIPKRKK